MTEFKLKAKINLTTIYKHYRIPQDQSKMDNPEKLGTQDEEKHNIAQHNTTQHVLDTTICKLFRRWSILHFIAI